MPIVSAMKEANVGGLWFTDDPSKSMRKHLKKQKEPEVWPSKMPGPEFNPKYCKKKKNSLDTQRSRIMQHTGRRKRHRVIISQL
jgi:hypothetical protein